MVKLLSGRLPDQSDPGRVLASENLQPLGVHIGSVLRIPLAPSSQRAAVLSNANLTPAGPTVTLHVVGLSVSEFAFPATSGSPAYDVYGTSSFALKCDAQTVVFNDYLFRLRHGAAGLPRFETQVRTLGGLSGTDLDGKSLGFIRRQIALSVSWQTRTIAVIGIVLGVPLGVAAGRLVWNAFASNLGVVAQPVVTAWVVATIAAGTLVVANVLAVGPALVASRAKAASLLKAE